MQANIRLFRVRKWDSVSPRKYSEFRNVTRAKEMIEDSGICWVDISSKCTKQLRAGNYSEYFEGFSTHEFEAIHIEIEGKHMVGVTPLY